MSVRLENSVRTEQVSVPWSMPTPPVEQGCELYVLYVRKSINLAMSFNT